MKIIRGFVNSVVDKGEGDKRWAIVAIDEKEIDRDGIEISKTTKCRVFGNALKGGLHNAYRQLQGVEVFAPVNVGVDNRNNEPEYLLSGIPLRLQEARPVQSAPAAQAAPAQAAGAK